jgi:hypothetical protein
MNRFIFLSGLIILVLLVSISLAGIPKLINYQGMLTQSNGTTPVDDGNYNLTFKIYGSLSGTDSLWREYHSNVSVTNGLFNVILGSITTLNLPFDTTYWLGIKVGSDPELSPRIQLTSVGYAYRALVADSARVATPGSGSHWSVTDSVLYTNKYWGIARGGAGNVFYGNYAYTMVNLGVACTTGASGQNYDYCTVGGGRYNTASRYYATVAGGYVNEASGAYATVGGGNWNSASGWSATVAGGRENVASGDSTTTVGGGYVNTASGDFATVAGGRSNAATGDFATVGGGCWNIAYGEYATVAGGYYDTASGKYATVPGGLRNLASGDYSFAAGRRAKANHDGAFVWADSTDADFASTGENQFLIRASGGVGIGTTNPDERLHVENSADGGRSFLQIEASHASNWGEAGMRIKTPQNTWHLRLDDDSNNNIPDGALGLRSQDLGSEVMVWTDSGNVGIGTANPQEKLHVWWGTNVDAELGRGGSDTDITYLALRNANGTKCYIYPNAAGNGIVVSTTKP